MDTFFEKRNFSNLKRLNALIEQLPSFCEDFFLGIENNTSSLTRLNYAYDLRIFFDYIIKKRLNDKRILDITLEDLDNLDVFFLERFLNYLTYYEYEGKTAKCNDRAKARKLSSVRSLYRYFFNKGLLIANTAAKIKTPKIHEKEIVRLVSNGRTDEIKDLLNEVEYASNLSLRQQSLRSELTKARDLAIFTFFLGTGLRISELVGLDENDIDFKNNSFKVTRKGGNQTILYFSDEIAMYLKEYLTLKNKGDSFKNKEKALFISSTQNKRISVRAVQELIKKYARVTTPLKNITPHKLRSTFGTQLYRATGDIYLVADVLGHKDVNTTKKHYAAMSDDLRKGLAGKVKLRGD